MVKAKGAWLERIGLNFESETHFHPNSTMCLVAKILKYRLVNPSESHYNGTSQLLICHVSLILSKCPSTVHFWYSSFP